uniref:Uncharacterized protein n=1 Tax=Aegilops tauschii subsp. strangulata TaxID=200361 RepID=A0A453RLZ4_AEGTS
GLKGGQFGLAELQSATGWFPLLLRLFSPSDPRSCGPQLEPPAIA